MNRMQYEEKDYFERVDWLYMFCVEDNAYRELFTNLIVVDLVTNFEVFIERTLKTFKKAYNNNNPTNCIVPDLIKIEHSRKIIEELSTIINHEHKNEKTKSIFGHLSKMWSEDGGKDVKIDIDTKYPRGKHGEMQLKKLFQKIDIADVLSAILIPLRQISILNEDENLDIGEFIAEITSKRNLAIHEGAPLHNSISLEDLQYMITTSKDIMVQINSIVNNKLNECFETTET